jgi:hypothetical protein
VRDFPLQAHLGPLVGGLAEAHADAFGAVVLVDEVVAVSVDRDASASKSGPQ